MVTLTHSLQSSLLRQVTHWLQAASRLSTLEHLASGNAWQGIDHTIKVRLKSYLQQNVNEVVVLGRTLLKQLDSSPDEASLRAAKRGLINLRDRYLKVEKTIHFYTVAINSRTTPNIAALLRACDILCRKSMQDLLQPLGKETPLILTHLEHGGGAAILKANLPLWDGSISPVAAVKITQHNLFRPTAIIHETGHQVAHILDWNEELATVFNTHLTNHSKMVGAAFAGWASEIAADAFAFVHTGFAAVAALHDVVSGTPQAVFAYHMHDPHPISYLRVLLNAEMCRQCYGAGPWDNLEAAFRNDYDIKLVSFASVGLINLCVPALPDVVKLILQHPLHAFGNRSLAQVIPPERVSPQALEKLEYLAGPALFTSHAWIWKESIRLLALNGYKIGLGEGNLEALYKQQEEWMMKLGFAVELN